LQIIEHSPTPVSVGLLGNAAELLPQFVALARSGGARPMQ
jgi:urocanate hydratase